MNWEALGSLAELFGALGVIASLLFLAFETRKNTKTARASLTHQAIKEIADLNDFAVSNPRLRDLISKSMTPGVPISEFSDEEWKDILHFGRAMFMRIEGMHILYKQGLIEEELWNLRREFMAGLMKFPIWKRYWEQDELNGVYTAEFINLINTANVSGHRAPVLLDD
ncbi:MAG: hypothetical protein RIC85_01625 [Gammaproteobacteria bacterium]